MTTHFAIMPAGITTQETLPTYDKDRRGVNSVALLDFMLFDMFRDAKRVSDRSEVEKALRMQSVRHQRQLDEAKAAQMNAFHGFRR